METGVARRGLMLVLSSPSGAGKTTIARRLREQDDGIEMSISHTTRPRRNGEENGKDYHFVDRESFTRMRDRGEFLEWAVVFDNFYGTTRKPVEDALAASRDHGRDGAGFGASALRIGRVLDIAAAMDGTVVGAQRGADMELRIGRMSTQHHALRKLEQIVHQCSFWYGTPAARGAMARPMKPASRKTVRR